MQVFPYFPKLSMCNFGFNAEGCEAVALLVYDDVLFLFITSNPIMCYDLFT